jgi:hypothetical protein
MALTKNFYSCCNLDGIIYSAKTGTDYNVGDVYIISAGNCYLATSDGPATAEVDDTLWSPITVDGCENPECQPCPTPTTTPTPGPTSTQTPTPTTTPTSTPTPTPTPTRITIISVNEQYATDFIDCCDVSGTTVPSDSYVPHPVWTNNDGDISIIQLNAVALGGFNGLNN